MASVQNTPAFLLKTNDLGESDRLLVFYTREEGKVRGVARGAKKSRKRFGAALDWFHLVKLSFRAGRSELLHMEEVETIWRSAEIGQNLPAYAVGSYFLELVRELTQDHHPDALIFDLLHGALQRLEVLAAQEKADGPQAIATLGHLFEMRLLDLLGFRPVLEACVECERKLRHLQEAMPRSSFEFSVDRGGLVCEDCLRQKGRARFGVLRSLSLSILENVIELLRHERWTMDPFQDLPAITLAESRQLKRLLADFIAYHTHKQLRSLAVMESIF